MSRYLNNGIYEVTYNLTQTANYTMTVLVDGENVVGSPFRIMGESGIT